MTDRIQSPAYHEKKQEDFTYKIFFDGIFLRGVLPPIHNEQQELIKGIYKDFVAKSIEEYGSDSAVWMHTVRWFMEKDVHRFLPIALSAYAHKNPSMFESNSVEIDLADLVESYGHDIHNLLEAAGYRKNQSVDGAESKKLEVLSLDVESIDDLPDFLPQEVKEGIMKLKKQLMSGEIQKGLNSGVLKITNNGAEIVSEAEYDEEHGIGEFQRLSQEIEMFATQHIKNAHDAPKTIH
ncbi:hypothetical protein QTV49_004226 [Vibrio vulnificus]|nr:hypothetical protein [Vibrio vulnificus]